MVSDELVEKVAEQVYNRERARVRSMVKWASVHGRRREMFMREARSILTLVEAALALLTDEREALEDWSFEHRPILSMKDGHIASCKCMDRVFVNGQEDWDQHIADSLLAAGFTRHPQVTDDYDAGYGEGFHHGRSTPRDVTVTPEMVDRAAQASATFVTGKTLSRRELGIGRQAWIVALEAALGGGE